MALCGLAKIRCTFFEIRTLNLNVLLNAGTEDLDGWDAGISHGFGLLVNTSVPFFPNDN